MAEKHQKSFAHKVVLFFLLFLLSVPIVLLGFFFISKAAPTKADIHINTSHITGPLVPNWKSLAQGGEESHVRMLQNVVPQVKDLAPRYIRIDHIYDFYDVVSRSNGNLAFNWSQLDETVCDIYATGAKPFFVLGYMPIAISSDGTLVGTPGSWDEWSQVVQQTIERYSGRNTTLCNGTISGNQLADIYYEVWNEPDLETFGKWSINGGEKDYKTLYFYSSQGAQNARNVLNFSLGGPATTGPYKNWFQIFLTYANEQKLRVDFLSWHHYTTDADDYIHDVEDINSWITPQEYGRYASLPKVLSEWGYDSNYNGASDTNVGAAHMIATIRNLVEQRLTHAFSFEVKDGPTPSWGILSHEGQKKPRYKALTFLNLLSNRQLLVDGEGTFVRAIASVSPQKLTTIIVNYDKNGRNVENVPVTFTGLTPGPYILVTRSLRSDAIVSQKITLGDSFRKEFVMNPNDVIAVELIRENP